ncbi:MAG: ABC transporter ATP-binding protein [Lachnospiraceae bacterium]
MIIELKNVSKVINGNVVLSDINIKFESGKVYGLIGINGSGKTMLMRTIAGLVIPTDGDILVDGCFMKKCDFLPDAGVMIENPKFLPEYGGFMNLKLISLVKKTATDEDIKNVLNRVGLPEKKAFRKYSLGMKKRLGIAAAIMEKPECLILDEPCNALDTEGISIFKDIVAEYKEMGKLIIISSHDKGMMEDLCDEIIVMENGKIINA